MYGEQDSKQGNETDMETKNGTEMSEHLDQYTH